MPEFVTKLPALTDHEALELIKLQKRLDNVAGATRDMLGYLATQEESLAKIPGFTPEEVQEIRGQFIGLRHLALSIKEKLEGAAHYNNKKE